MGQLKQTAIVPVPFARAADLVEEFLTEHASDDGSVSLRLEAPSNAVLGIGNLVLQRDVIVSFRRSKGPNESIVFALHWESAEGGPYPVFDGALTVAEDETYSTCRLILEGSYTPPGWAAGAVFDAAIGSRIAEATAKALLAKIGAAMSLEFEAMEREKQRRPTEV